MKARRSLLAGLLASAVFVSARAGEPKPRVPPAIDPGGLAIAIPTTGIDYTVPEIARRLARDGEGELVGWDFAAGDNRPYASGAASPPAGWADDTADLTRRLSAMDSVRLIPLRIDPAVPTTLAQAVAFAAQASAPVMLVAVTSDRPQDWAAFRQAALRFPQITIITAIADPVAGTPRSPPYPAALGLETLVVIGDASDPAANMALADEARAASDHGPAQRLARFMRALQACAAAQDAAVLGDKKLQRLFQLLASTATARGRPATPSPEACAVRPLQR